MVGCHSTLQSVQTIKGRYLSNDLRWLLASDLHFPKHEPRYIDLLFQVIRKWKPHAIDLPGDIDDAEGTSRWADGSVDEVHNPIESDMRILRQFSYDLRQAAMKSTEIHWHDGNHGWTRHDNYIKTKAKALDGMLSPDILYDLKKNGIQWHSYQDPPVRRFGDMHVHHGMAISKHAGESVRNDMDKWGVSLIRGHSHRVGNYNKSVVFTDENKTMTLDLEGYEIGHLCNVSKMTYDNVHNWQPGFMIGWVVDGKRPHMKQVRIHDYTCIIDGIKFEA